MDGETTNTRARSSAPRSCSIPFWYKSTRIQPNPPESQKIKSRSACDSLNSWGTDLKSCWEGSWWWGTLGECRLEKVFAAGCIYLASWARRINHHHSTIKTCCCFFHLAFSGGTGTLLARQKWSFSTRKDVLKNDCKKPVGGIASLHQLSLWLWWRFGLV